MSSAAADCRGGWWYEDAVLWPLPALDDSLLAGQPLATYAALVLTEQLRRLGRYSLTGERPGFRPGLRADDHFARQHRTPVRVDLPRDSAHGDNRHE